MFSQDFIDTSIPIIRLSDSVGYALTLMQDYKAENLAVVDDTTFVGVLSESFLEEFDDATLIQTLQSNFLQYKIEEGTHLFDVLKVIADQKAYFLPVVNSANEYIGLITPQKIVHYIATNTAFAASGGIIVLELAVKDYSLTEISRLVESNNAMILQSMVSTTASQQVLQVSLKINKNDLKDIQLTFERYQYTVLAVFHQSEYETQLKERYESLMKYLEV